MNQEEDKAVAVCEIPTSALKALARAYADSKQPDENIAAVLQAAGLSVDVSLRVDIDDGKLIVEAVAGGKIGIWVNAEFESASVVLTEAEVQTLTSALYDWLVRRAGAKAQWAE